MTILVQIANFVSDATGLPGALWHVCYDDPDIGEEDLEEFEVLQSVSAAQNKSMIHR